jgi:hypothetical protein
MRTPLFLAALTFAGCAWTDFDDLSDTAWVHSIKSPGIGSRNYALSILGVSATPTGGTLAVVSDDTPDLSTVDYAADGGDSVSTNNSKLGQFRIAVLSNPPLFATDGAGKVAIAERSTAGGVISVVSGFAGAPFGFEFPANPPDAVVYAGGQVVVAGGNTLYTLKGSSQVPCPSTDMAFGVVAMAADATNVWLWAKTGAFFSVPIASLDPCTNLPAAGATFTPPNAFMPGPGARIHLVGSFAVLTAHAPMSRMAQLFVVNLATMMMADSMMIDGLESSAVGTFGTGTYLIVGVPDRPVDGIVTGQVDAHALDMGTGTLTKTSALTLNDAQPDSGQLFGRSVTTMKLNDKQIIVVAANSEVFAYYKTALYDALP